MKSESKLLFVVSIILLSITSIYPLNSIKDKKIKPTEEKNSFWVKYELNWKNTNYFNTNSYLGKE
jgi:hypothetical protein